MQGVFFEDFVIIFIESLTAVEKLKLNNTTNSL